MHARAVILDSASRRDERRRLWRELIHTEAAQVERAAQAKRVATDEFAWVDSLEAGAGARDFARVVQLALQQGPELPWGHRQKLIRLGASVGLSRFDASLVIASVQQKRRGSRTTVSPGLARGDERVAQMASLPPAGRGLNATATLVVAFIAVEVLLILAWLAR